MQVHNFENDSIDRDRCPTTVLFGEPGHDPLRLPRGLRPAGNSPYGIQDMGGGVMEWTFDYYGGYDAEDTLNPLGPRKWPLSAVLLPLAVALDRWKAHQLMIALMSAYRAT